MRFKAVKPKKLSEEIADQIRELIAKGEIRPGERLPPERELAEMLGVSRPPVREAINGLVAMGFLEKRHGEGTIVRSVVSGNVGDTLTALLSYDKEKVIELMEVRRGLESWTAYYAAMRRTDEDSTRIGEIFERMERDYLANEASERDDSALHLAIAEATHNLIWQHLMHTIFDVLEGFLALIWKKVYLTPEDRRLLLEQHREIVGAIQRGEGQAAYAAMIAHLSFAETKTLDYIGRHQIDALMPTPG